MCSEKGWIRTLRGHLTDFSGLHFKEGDRSKFVLSSHTTDRLLLLRTGGKFFTLERRQLPGGRGHGEPLRLMIDLEAAEGIADRCSPPAGRPAAACRLDGNGFIAPEEEVPRQYPQGQAGDERQAAGRGDAGVRVPAAADHLAVIGDNRKLVIFPLDQVPEMARGRGVRLQKYKGGSLSDARAFRLGRRPVLGRFIRPKLDRDGAGDWLGERAQAGRMPPKGFPRSNRFEELRSQRPASAN